MSRQSSFNDETSYRTPESSSHRGASLPPTPTKTPKILSRIVNQNKPFNSLPPTPGRQLPQPNVNYRSAKGRRNSLIKRTSSVEYTEGIDNYYNSYTRPGAVSARELHDDYYNYMYESSDNLPTQIDTTDTTAMIANDNASMNMLDYSQNTHSFNQQIDNLYYNTQDEGIYHDQGGYETTNEPMSLGKPSLGHSLLPRNAESLESHDDELRDSFETAISSISSSLHRRGITSDYVTSTETITANTTPLTVPSADSGQKIPSLNLQYKKDQESPSKNYSLPASNEDTFSPRGNFPNRGYLKQQESVDSSYFQQYINGQHSEEYADKQMDRDPYLEYQESVESYVEEVPDDVAEEHGNKAINNRESPASVIHMERFEDDGSLRRGSSQLTVIDPYHPMHPSGRRQSVVDSRRTSGDLHQQGDESYPISSPRKASIDPYQAELARSGSIRRSPPGHQLEVDAERYQSPTEEEIREEKKASFEEDAEVKAPRQQITAQQRWLWAYNKIIMQLNVSTRHIFSYIHPYNSTRDNKSRYRIFKETFSYYVTDYAGLFMFLLF